MIFIRVQAPHFVAGALFNHGIVVKCSPKISCMWSWPPDRVLEYCERQGWTCDFMYECRVAGSAGIAPAKRSFGDSVPL